MGAVNGGGGGGGVIRGISLAGVEVEGKMGGLGFISIPKCVCGIDDNKIYRT